MSGDVVVLFTALAVLVTAIICALCIVLALWNR